MLDGEIDEALDRELLRLGAGQLGSGLDQLGDVGRGGLEDGREHGRLAAEVVQHRRLRAPGRGRDVLQ
jgi:hypothetical protein